MLVLTLPVVVKFTVLIVAGNSTTIVPDDVIGLFVTTNEVLDTPTLMTDPPELAVEIVTLPLLLLNDIPVPALNLVTPVFTIVILPVVVMGPPDTCIPVPEATIPTLVTVPTEFAFAIEVTLPYWSTVIVG